MHPENKVLGVRPGPRRQPVHLSHTVDLGTVGNRIARLGLAEIRYGRSRDVVVSRVGVNSHFGQVRRLERRRAPGQAVNSTETVPLW